jgi:glycosyltransferase involved in cell wall biosynthesis
MAQPSIAYLVHSLDPGGTERLALDMALWFSHKYRMQIFCLDTPGQWAGDARAQGISVTCLNRRPGVDLSVPVRLAAWMKITRIDLIHAHQYTPWFYGGLARILRPKTKIIFQEHGRHYPEIRKTKRILFNRLVLSPLTHRITAVSRDIRQRLVVYEGLKNQKIEVIYNGTCPLSPVTDDDRTALRAALGFESDDVVVAAVGRLDPVKNLALFFEGIARVAEKVPRIKGLIVGDGPEADRLHARVQALGLSDRIVFTGFREDAVRLVQAADVFALVSFSEGTSMALLEAMAAGVPAVVTRVGGNSDIVADGRTGWVIESGDLEQLTGVLYRAVGDAGLRKTMGRAGQQQFFRQFEFNAMARAYDQLYQSVLT